MADSYIIVRGTRFSSIQLNAPSDSTILAADTIICQNLQTGEETTYTRSADSKFESFSLVSLQSQAIKITAPQPLVGRLSLVQFLGISQCTVYNTGDFPDLRFTQCVFESGCVKSFITTEKQKKLWLVQCEGAGLSPLDLSQYSADDLRLIQCSQANEVSISPGIHVSISGLADWETSLTSTAALGILTTLDDAGQSDGYVYLAIQQPEDTAQIQAKKNSLKAKGWTVTLHYFAQPVLSDSSSSSVGGGGWKHE